MKLIRAPRQEWTRSFGVARVSYEHCLVHAGRLVAVERDGNATVWDLADGRELWRLPAELAEWQLEDARGVYARMHPDGLRLFVTVSIVDVSDVTLCWDLERGVLLRCHESDFTPSAFIGRDLAVSANGLNLVVWELSTEKILRTLHRRDVSWGVLGTLGEHVLVQGRDTVELWHLRDGEMVWETAARAGAVAGELAVLVEPGSIVLRAADGAVVRQLAVPELTEHVGQWGVEASEDLAVVARGPLDLLAVDLGTGEVKARLPSPDAYPEVALVGANVVVTAGIFGDSAVWSPSTCRLRVPGPLVLTPDANQAIVRDGKWLRLYPVDGRQVAAVPDWSKIAIAEGGIVALDRDRTVHVAERSSWRLPSENGRVELCGGFVALVEESAIAVLDAATGERLRTLAMPKPWSVAVAEKVVAATSEDGEVRLWSLETGAALSAFRVRERLSDLLAADTRRLAIAGGTAIELWRGDKPVRLHTFRSRTRATCAALTRRFLVSGHVDGALLVRDIEARQHRATLEAHDGAVRAIAIRGELVASCGWDARVTLWDLGTGERLDGFSGDHDLCDLVWLDDDTLACAGAGGLTVLRR